MLSSIWKYIWSSTLVIGLAGSGFAQKLKNPADSIRGIHPPTGIRIGTDLIAIGKTIGGAPLGGWEIDADMDLGRYYIAAEFGKWVRDQKLDNGHYKNDGTYWRVGIDVNFLLKDPDKNMFFIGFRYGHSAFSEQIEFSSTTTDYGDYKQTAVNPSVTAGWAELVTGLRVKIYKQFWMGYTGRLKFLPGTKGNSSFASYDIPGCGLAEKTMYWGFNYQVFWRIPLKK